ncbi:hypothetical protein OG819_42355 [Streptomyces sp. NBC_01549]|nr:hypothetical protein [Streptomyces sp. NBC_01549]MCX4596058.1 hypothetical protein [Streptomyces sp. NBC_01549]
MQQGTAHHPSPPVVDVLALPSLTGLSEQQVRGLYQLTRKARR